MWVGCHEPFLETIAQPVSENRQIDDQVRRAGRAESRLDVRKKPSTAHAAPEARSRLQLGRRLKHHEQLLALVTPACSNKRSLDHELRLRTMRTDINVSAMRQAGQEVRRVAVRRHGSAPLRSEEHHVPVAVRLQTLSKKFKVSSFIADGAPRADGGG